MLFKVKIPYLWYFFAVKIHSNLHYMKTTGVIVFFLSMLFSLSTKAQNTDCGEEASIVLSGAVQNIFVSDCDKDVSIVTNNEDTYVSGYVEIGDSKSIRFIPSEKFKIRIRPGQGRDNPGDYEPKPSDRTKVGAKDSTDGDKPDFKRVSSTTVYPNPVQNTLVVNTTETIVNYKIVNSFGIVYQQGNQLKGTISVQSLPKGLYRIVLQTNKQIITKTFLKN